MNKSLGVLLHFWAFCYSHKPNPSPHPTNNVGRVYLEFLTLYRVGKGELQENFEKDALIYEGTQKDRKI